MSFDCCVPVVVQVVVGRDAGWGIVPYVRSHARSKDPHAFYHTAVGGSFNTLAILDFYLTWRWMDGFHPPLDWFRVHNQNNFSILRMSSEKRVTVQVFVWACNTAGAWIPQICLSESHDKDIAAVLLHQHRQSRSCWYTAQAAHPLQRTTNSEVDLMVAISVPSCPFCTVPCKNISVTSFHVLVFTSQSLPLCVNIYYLMYGCAALLIGTQPLSLTTYKF